MFEPCKENWRQTIGPEEALAFILLYVIRQIPLQ